MSLFSTQPRDYFPERYSDRRRVIRNANLDMVGSVYEVYDVTTGKTVAEFTSERLAAEEARRLNGSK